MKKVFLSFFLIVLLISAFSLNFVFAKNPSTGSGQANDIPEQDGIYNVPGHPELKVRVFVHREKPAKPGKPQPPTPSLTCGLDDPQSSAFVDKEVWHLPTTWTYNLNPSSVPSLVGGSNLFTITENGFNVWENAISNKVNVVRGSDTTITRKALDGINVITWGKASLGALGVTYIWYYPSTGEVAELDTIMNKAYVWTWSGGTTNCAYTESYDAQNILTHEIGHWFGLDDEYDVTNYQNATMYGYGSKTEVKKNTLTTGDINGVKVIY